ASGAVEVDEHRHRRAARVRLRDVQEVTACLAAAVDRLIVGRAGHARARGTGAGGAETPGLSARGPPSPAARARCAGGRRRGGRARGGGRLREVTAAAREEEEGGQSEGSKSHYASRKQPPCRQKAREVGAPA